jgi:D-alanyl-lipoteichoic acid acyltransferase DltB (MBOAT superfamily)
MLFNSFPFIVFFPVVLTAYYVIPRRFRWIWLLASSFFFYMSWRTEFALLLAAAIVFSFFPAQLIKRSSRSSRSGRSALPKLWLVVGISINLLMLFIFKYYSFFIESINVVLTGTGIRVISEGPSIMLPLGISFYTFRVLSYMIDVYRGKIKPERNLAKYALYVAFFPQIVSGPIERADSMMRVINDPPDFSFERMRSGFLLMLWGYFQKMVIADRVAVLVNNVFNNYMEFAGFQIAIAVMLYAVQIYCDFAGYSDIAIGAAEALGFPIVQNFRQPYLAQSIQEFWRRWHISLSTWFRDYLYFPLGGSRVSKWRKHLNVMIVFLASGLWHGANWNFVIWGALHGMYQVIAELVKPIKRYYKADTNDKPERFSSRLTKMISTFLLVDFAWIFFRATDMGQAIGIIRQMFALFNPWVFFDGSLYSMGLDYKDLQLALVCIAVLTFVNWVQNKYPNTTIRERIIGQNIVFRWIFYYAFIFIILTFGMYGPGYDAAQFVYAGF